MCPGGSPQPLAHLQGTPGIPAHASAWSSHWRPWSKAIVFRKLRELPAYREVDDFISGGLEALITSIERYDPDKGATLEQCTWTWIHGAVLDELRRFDWAAVPAPHGTRDASDPEHVARRVGARFRAAFAQLPERERKVALLLHVQQPDAAPGSAVIRPERASQPKTPQLGVRIPTVESPHSTPHFGVGTTTWTGLNPSAHRHSMP